MAKLDPPHQGYVLTHKKLPGIRSAEQREWKGRSVSYKASNGYKYLLCRHDATQFIRNFYKDLGAPLSKKQRHKWRKASDKDLLKRLERINDVVQVHLSEELDISHGVDFFNQLPNGSAHPASKIAKMLLLPENPLDPNTLAPEVYPQMGYILLKRLQANLAPRIYARRQNLFEFMALFLAIKTQEDSGWFNIDLVEILGQLDIAVSIKEVNDLERDFLQAIDFTVSISPEELNSTHLPQI